MSKYPAYGSAAYYEMVDKIKSVKVEVPKIIKEEKVKPVKVEKVKEEKVKTETKRKIVDEDVHQVLPDAKTRIRKKVVEEVKPEPEPEPEPVKVEPVVEEVKETEVKKRGRFVAGSEEAKKWAIEMKVRKELTRKNRLQSLQSVAIATTK